MALKNTLKELGFNDKEINVYQTLLKQGRQTPASLSKKTKINRATVYNIAKSLHSKGVVAEDLSGKTLYFVALPPGNLNEVIERPMRELEKRRAVAKKAIEEASMIAAEEEYPVPSIRFIEEDELNNFLYSSIEKWQASVRENDNAWWGIQDDSWLEHFQAFNDWYWESPLSEDVSMNMVGNESKAEMTAFKKHANKLRNIRFDTETLFSASIWVGGDYLIMIVTRKQPFYAVEIHDKTLSHNMRKVFKKLWTQAAV